MRSYSHTNPLKRSLFLFLFLFLSLLCPAQSQDKQTAPPFGIVIHGGAGTLLRSDLTPELEKAYTDKLNEALDAGYKVLENNGSSLDAVEAAIRVLEDSRLFNAGRGSVFAASGRNEMDAAIMDGKTLKAGAVAGVRTVKNPVTAARCVMEKSPHVLLVGEGADRFAKQCGCGIADSTYFYTDKRWKQLLKAREEEKLHPALTDSLGMLVPYPAADSDKKFGTVGAVALDKQGNLAAATSTGGMTNKMSGRVGDSPLIGAGTYANNLTCAISCTGHGEYFIRHVVAYDVSALMEYKGLSLEESGREVIMKKLLAVKGEGGLIGIDRMGNMTLPFNTPGMYRGFRSSTGKRGAFIFQ